MRLSTCLKALVYVGLLLGWNYICSRHYATQTLPRIKLKEEGRGQRLDKATTLASSSGRPTSPLAVTVSEKPAAKTAAPKAASAAAAARGGCPADLEPFHTVLTAQATTYQAWQSRIMYHHWKKQAAAAGPCGEMSGFTRLVASDGGLPDDLEKEMPSVFVKAMTTEELAAHGHFGVLNRPVSVLQFVQTPEFASIAEGYVYIAETDHVLMKPLPNLARGKDAAAFGFGYMHTSQSVQSILDDQLPAFPQLGAMSWRDIAPIGPSPLTIRKEQLRRVTPLWLNLSLALKRNKRADARFGWVLEMWGYAIAAAALGIKHEVKHDFQAEFAGGATGANFRDRAFIFHYTYGMELSLDGHSQQGQIGEWSLDKRHYGGAYPPRNLQRAPELARGGRPEAADFLLDAFNEASAAIPTWPETKALGTVGWRRVGGAGIEGSDLGSRLLGSSWTWANIESLQFQAKGALKTPWGTGVWGILPKGKFSSDGGFCDEGCAFVDFSSALHNVRFDFSTTPPTFKTWRVGDGESVEGKQIQRQ